MYRFIEKDLELWKNQQDRKPLLLRGARQIGKSYTVEKFGREHFDNIVLINFEINKLAHTSFKLLEPHKIISSLSLSQQVLITPGKTLLFLDEIQECPEAISALRYFKEQLPELHVIAAGSLLEFALQEAALKLPVGRVQYLYMKPCSFAEFVFNSGGSQVTDYLSKVNLKNEVDEALHNKLLDKLREYFVLGGMPEVLVSYEQHLDFYRCQQLQSTLFESYPRDFGKYGKNVNVHNLLTLYQYIPNVVARRFVYSHVNADITIRELKPALQALIQAGLIYPYFHTSASGLPLHATMNHKKFKTLFLDIGLCKYSTELDVQIYTQNDLILLNKGALAEQFVGQELLAYKENYRAGSLYYWEREKSGSSAEIDFLITVGSNIYPIEVKSGKTGRLKSLQIFMQEKSSPFGIRISEQPLSFEKNILSVPFYLIQQLPRLIQEIEN